MLEIEDQARAAFLAVLERPPDQWAAALDQACGGNAELRARVEQLLRAHREIGSIHAGPSDKPAATIDEPHAERPGTVIGPYKLLEQIGEGGMGTVWMAQQTEPVKRLVALKLIKAGMDSKQIIARFEAERQALALMDHPNIAKVLDAGTTAPNPPTPFPRREGGEDGSPSPLRGGGWGEGFGRPYFVMELVKGVPITKYCDEHHLTPRQRLELFIPVCQAVQHAHQKGIIHRDLKPSNVLVALYDGRPVPKVIDFGVAKATGQPLTENTLVTGFGAIVGTLEYMSPEQAEVNQFDIDTRSDIYSLGVLLYELLTGSPPFTRKELEKAGMLEMLRVIREQEPSKPSTKLSTAEGLPTLAANRGTEPAKLTRLVRGELDWIVMMALEKDRNRRYGTANGFAMDVQRYLADEPVLACPPSVGYRLRKFVRRNKRALAMATVLAAAVLVVVGTLGWGIRDRQARAQEEDRERAARQTAIDQEVNLALKEAEQWQAQEEWPEALSAAKRAQGLLAGGGSDELRERTHQLRKDLEMVLRLERIRVLASGLKRYKFDWQIADQAYAQAFAEYGIDVAALSEEAAAARIRARTGVVVVLVTAMDEWSHARNPVDNAGRRALTALAQAADPDPWRRRLRQVARQEDTDALVALAAGKEFLSQPPTSLLLLVRVLRNRGLSEPEIKVLRRAQREYPGDFWINFNLGTVLSNMGPSYHDEAISFLRAALAVRPQNIAAHNNLGVALAEKGKLDEAIASYRKAIEIEPRFVPVHTSLGVVLRAQGKLDEAIRCYRRAIELDPKYALAYSDLGIALGMQDDLPGAIASFRQALKLNPNDATDHSNLGLALAKLGNLNEAIASYRSAIELNPKETGALSNLAWLLATCAEPKLRHPAQAVALAKKAVELSPDQGSFWNTLGVAHYRARDWKAALAALEKSVTLRNGGTSFDWLFLAMTHWQLGEKDKAHEWYDKAIEWMDKNQPKDEELRRFRAEAAELMKHESGVRNLKSALTADS
jgi:serine/threonine protein kinase/tetratricopeptide (TPR) repeat protein